MRQIDYDKQTLEKAEQELRRLVIVSLYGLNKKYILLTKEQLKVLNNLLTEEQKERLKQGKQTMLKAFFKQLETYKKKYAEELKQKD